MLVFGLNPPANRAQPGPAHLCLLPESLNLKCKSRSLLRRKPSTATKQQPANTVHHQQHTEQGDRGREGRHAGVHDDDGQMMEQSLFCPFWPRLSDLFTSSGGGGVEVLQDLGWQEEQR